MKDKIEAFVTISVGVKGADTENHTLITVPLSRGDRAKVIQLLEMTVENVVEKLRSGAGKPRSKPQGSGE